MTKPVTKPVTKSVTKLNRILQFWIKVPETGKFVASVSITVSAEVIGQLEFQYRTETKIVVSVVHYL